MSADDFLTRIFLKHLDPSLSDKQLNDYTKEINKNYQEANTSLLHDNTEVTEADVNNLLKIFEKHNLSCNQDSDEDDVENDIID